MALVENITPLKLGRDVDHRSVECTFDVITNTDGERFLQLDTYGSSERKLQGKKSQSLRLSPSALQQLKQIIQTHKL